MDELNRALEELGFHGLGGGFGANLRALVLQARRAWGVADLSNQRVLGRLSIKDLLKVYENAFSARVPGLSAMHRKRLLIGMVISRMR